MEQMDADVPRDSKISEHEYSRYFADAYLGCYMDTALNVAGDRIVCEVGVGLGRIVTLCYRSSTLYHIH